MGHDWFKSQPKLLPPAERVDRYRDLARKALKEAESAKGEARQMLMHLAESWDRLASLTEDMVAREADVSIDADVGQQPPNDSSRPSARHN
jgi:hypothetical protein